MVAAQKRAGTLTNGARSFPQLHPNRVLLSGVIQQALIATIQLNGEKRVGHWIHDSWSRFLRSAHTAPHTYRGTVLPSQIGQLAHEHHDSVNCVLIFKALSRQIRFGGTRPLIDDGGCGFATHFIGFSNAQTTLTCPRLGGNPNGGSLSFQLRFSTSLFIQEGFCVAQGFQALRREFAGIFDAQWLLALKCKTKAFQHGLPTGENNQIITIMHVWQTKQHHGCLGHAVQLQSPAFNRSGLKDRGFRTMRCPWYLDVLMRLQNLRFQFFHAPSLPSFHRPSQTKLPGGVGGLRALNSFVLAMKRGALGFNGGLFQKVKHTWKPFDWEVFEPRVVGWWQRCTKSLCSTLGLGPIQLQTPQPCMPCLTNPKLLVRVFAFIGLHTGSALRDRPVHITKNRKKIIEVCLGCEAIKHIAGPPINTIA